MPELHVFQSNRLEVLADRLASVLREPSGDPLVPETVLVQTPAVGRWLAAALAERLGAWLGGRFPLPNVYLDGLFREAAGGAGGGWDPEVLRWRLMGLLPRCLAEEGFEAPRRYLAGDQHPLKLYQLADRIARVFDGYALFRPERVLAWERGAEPDPWQARLWCHLAAADPNHRAALRRRFLETLEAGTLDHALPARLAVFGASALPPFHLETLAALARRTDVHLLLLNPCREYWAEVRTGAWIARLAAAGAGDLHYEEGNRLLASLGQAGQDFFRRVQELPAREADAFRDPEGDSLLAALQTDVLHLREPGPAGGRRRWRPDDDSVRVHSCHSPMREVEVLRDALLDLFQRHPDLEPRHVAVLTPDVAAYAPFVEAVFAGEEEPRIPFAIADRAARGGSPLADAFLGALGLAGGRFGAPEVLDLLECAAVRRRFDLTPADLERVRGWVRETRIRWGVDGDHRHALGLPGYDENTWRAGLDRLLLGYALPGGGERLFAGVLPHDGVEGAEAAAALGRLAEFVDRLFGGCQGLEAAREVAAWSEALATFFDDLFRPDEEEEREAALVRGALTALADAAARAGYHEPVELEVVRRHLGAALERIPFGGGFGSGAVTLGSIRSPRGIPFPVVCLIGMSDGAFPRPSPAAGFDLVALDPRPGDRSPRHEDRYVFLEAILAAGRHLHVSYVGQSERDGGEIPPAVPVSELLDAIDQGFEPPEGPGKPGRGWARSRLVTRHRLQAFSPAYFREEPGEDAFRGPALFSYSEADARASRHLRPGVPRRTRGPFLERLPEPPAELRQVDLRDLERFLENPARHLLRARLRVHLADEAAVVDEREPFAVEGLERYGLAGRLAALGLEERPLGEALAWARAEGSLPHGAVGDGAFQDLRADVEAFLAAVRPHLVGPPRDAFAFAGDLEVGGWEYALRGRLEGLRADRLVLHRPATVKPRDRLRLWVRHLALNWADDGAVPRRSVLVGADRAVDLRPLPGREAAEALLRDLLALYAEGLVRLVPFFPRSSWAYARHRAGGGDRGAALRAARAEWEGGYRTPAERDERHFALAFGDPDPLGEAFEVAAERVFGPLLACEAAEGPP